MQQANTTQPQPAHHMILLSTNHELKLNCEKLPSTGLKPSFQCVEMKGSSIMPAQRAHKAGRLPRYILERHLMR